MKKRPPMLTLWPKEGLRGLLFILINKLDREENVLLSSAAVTHLFLF